MKLRSLLALVAISALTFGAILPANAQGGGGGGFGGAGGGGQRRGGPRGAQSPWALATRPDVQKDIQVTDDEKTKLQAASDDMRAKMREAFQAGGQGGDRAAMMATMQKMNDDFAVVVKGILTPTQQDRLVQIYIQLNKTSSVTNPDVQTKIGLSADKVAKIKALQDGMMKANGEIMAKVQSGELDRAASRELTQKNNEAMKTELDKVLSDDDKAKLKAAEGAPFTADPAPARGGGGARRAGAGGGN